MTNTVDLAVLKILQLSESEFCRIAIIKAKVDWTYVGSDGKDSGKDAHWISFKDGNFTSLTSAIYGQDEEYMLVQETNMDLEILKLVAASVIPIADCTAGLDPEKESDLSQIIYNIAHNLPAHGGHTDMITNPKLSEEAEKRSMKEGAALINKVFFEAVAGFGL